MSRRDFIKRAAQTTAAAGCGGLLWFALLRQQSAQAAVPLRPPGARAERDFSALCIKCGQCVQACPYHTLSLAKPGEPAVTGTPRFAPRDVPCFMCEDIPCAKACPTGALDRGLRDIRDARMGLAVVDPASCLSWQGLRCEVCFRACPVSGKAITIAPHPRQLSRHAVFVPLVHAEACTGCGVCEKRCPTEVAAIRIVDPALVQGKIGAHYRMEWNADVPREGAPPSEPSRSIAPPPKAERPPAQQGLDWLNQKGTP